VSRRLERRAWTAGSAGVLLSVIGVLCLAHTAGAQGSLSLRGTVVRQTLDGTRPVPRERVTLHRVNAQDAGPIDSALTDGRGTYAFRVPAPDAQSMYLVSARYGGIAYFSPPVQGEQPGAPAEIVVYDTTSRDVRLRLQGRHVVVSAPSADGARQVIDVLEIENDTIVTRVAGPGNRATFDLLLPDGARNVRATQGEMSDAAVEVREGRAQLYSPLSPGLRQLVLTYELGADAFPVAVPLERAVAVLEVLLEERGATAVGGGLASQGGVSVEGKNFTRYLGQNSPEGTVLTLSAGSRVGSGGLLGPPWVLPLLLTLATLGVILFFARGRAVVVAPPTAPSGAPGSRSAGPRATASRVPPTGGSIARADSPDALARRVAALDAVMASAPGDATSLREQLARERETLREELIDLLARGTTVP